MFLQTQTKVIENSTSVILNYGAVGAMLVICILAIIFMVRFFVKQNLRRENQFTEQISLYSKQIEALTKKLNDYIEEDRKEMIQVIRDNTNAFKEFTRRN